MLLGRFFTHGRFYLLYATLNQILAIEGFKYISIVSIMATSGPFFAWLESVLLLEYY